MRKLPHDDSFPGPLTKKDFPSGLILHIKGVKRMKMEFFMSMNPPTVTHQEKKVHVVNGKPVFYDPDDLRVAREKLIGYLYRHRPVAGPWRGPVRLVTKWCFPATEKHPAHTWRITKPDTDNLQKLLKDCMTITGFWKDDAQVVSEEVEKFWSDIPGIYIRMEDLQK